MPRTSNAPVSGRGAAVSSLASGRCSHNTPLGRGHPPGSDRLLRGTARTVRASGPRSSGRLLLEPGREFSAVAVAISAMLERYAVFDPGFVACIVGTDWLEPSDLARAVAGGRP